MWCAVGVLSTRFERIREQQHDDRKSLTSNLAVMYDQRSRRSVPIITRPSALENHRINRPRMGHLLLQQSHSETITVQQPKAVEKEPVLDTSTCLLREPRAISSKQIQDSVHVLCRDEMHMPIMSVWPTLCRRTRLPCLQGRESCH